MSPVVAQSSAHVPTPFLTEYVRARKLRFSRAYGWNTVGTWAPAKGRCPVCGGDLVRGICVRPTCPRLAEKGGAQ